tara:strand:- start:2479 stop:2958 length:480 start_codon:yes stop_codon:yes gene_type:complete
MSKKTFRRKTRRRKTTRVRRGGGVGSSKPQSLGQRQIKKTKRLKDDYMKAVVEANKNDDAFTKALNAGSSDKVLNKLSERLSNSINKCDIYARRIKRNDKMILELSNKEARRQQRREELNAEKDEEDEDEIFSGTFDMSLPKTAKNPAKKPSGRSITRK